MSAIQIAGALLIGLGAGILSGLFGVGGGIVMTPALEMGLGTAPILSLATPLPVILPTAVAGALRYRKAGEVDLRAAGWMSLAGVAASALGAALTDVIDTHLLLLITAVLLAWQAVSVLRGVSRPAGTGDGARAGAMPFLVIGGVAGLVSGLLGVGGGIIMVPAMVRWLGMPLKRALGTSLAAIVVLVIPGTIVHALLGNIDWALTVVLILGAVPGARIGAGLALGTAERTLRILVGTFLLLVALVFAIGEATAFLGS